MYQCALCSLERKLLGLSFFALPEHTDLPNISIATCNLLAKVSNNNDDDDNGPWHHHCYWQLHHIFSMPKQLLVHHTYFSPLRQFLSLADSRSCTFHPPRCPVPSWPSPPFRPSTPSKIIFPFSLMKRPLHHHAFLARHAFHKFLFSLSCFFTATYPRPTSLPYTLPT